MYSPIPVEAVEYSVQLVVYFITMVGVLMTTLVSPHM